MDARQIEEVSKRIAEGVAKCVTDALTVAFAGESVAAPAVTVWEYERSEFGHIVTLTVDDIEDRAPVVDLAATENADALSLDPTTFADEFWCINVYRLRRVSEADRLGSNGYVLGAKAFATIEEAYRRRRGRKGKDFAYEGVVEIGARTAKRLGYTLAV